MLDEEAVIEGKHERVETIYLRHLIDNDGPEFRPMEVGEVAEGAPRDQQNLSVIIGIPEVVYDLHLDQRRMRVGGDDLRRNSEPLEFPKLQEVL